MQRLREGSFGSIASGRARGFRVVTTRAGRFANAGPLVSVLVPGQRVIVSTLSWSR